MIIRLDFEEDREVLNSLRHFLAKATGKEDTEEGYKETLDFYRDNMGFKVYGFRDHLGCTLGYIIANDDIIAEMCVLPGWRGMGIGSSLVDWVCNGFTALLADEKAESFYMKLGFRAVGRDPITGDIRMIRGA